MVRVASFPRLSQRQSMRIKIIASVASITSCSQQGENLSARSSQAGVTLQSTPSPCHVKPAFAFLFHPGRLILARGLKVPIRAAPLVSIHFRSSAALRARHNLFDSSARSSTVALELAGG